MYRMEEKVMGNKFLDLFNTKKPVIGMIHLKGNNDEEYLKSQKKKLMIFTTMG